VTRHKRRVLLTAYSANPAAQSEPLNGYKYIRELAKVADVKIIAHERDRADLAKTELAADIRYAGSARLAGGLRSITRPLFKESWHLISLFDFADYAVFDAGALRLARRLHRKYRFEIAHRVTPTTVRFPSMLWRLGLPTVSGPHNGGMTWPDGFAHLARAEGTADGVRSIGDAFHRFVGDFRAYSRILVANEWCRAVVPKEYRHKAVEVAVNGVEEVVEPSPYAGDATKLLFVGRLVPFKCADIAIKALSRLPHEVKLTIVGDGPERQSLEALARERAVVERVTFTGWLPQRETLQHYREAGAFVFPSVRESGGAVVLDAMAAGLPVIAAAWAGPLQFLGDAGITVSVESPLRLESEIAQAVKRLLANPESARALGLRAQQRVRDEYLWPRKAERIAGIYEEVLAARQ
jgi:glycosyltransferase involved in cell wall biosynthesis